jgi:hypothetical protein
MGGNEILSDGEGILKKMTMLFDEAVNQGRNN